MIGRLKPAAVIGFGGYPTMPPVLAAAWRGVPTPDPRRERRASAAPTGCWRRGSTAIATTFPTVSRGDRGLAAKATLTGNPVRPAVVAAAATPYPAPGDPLRLLVFGGSQGARVMADVVPAAIGAARAGLARAARHRRSRRARRICARVRGAYARARRSPRRCAPFFPDLPARMAASHLIVARSGASTVAELAAIGRPAILVPLPHALDQDQFANAGVLETCRRRDPAGAGRVYPAAARRRDRRARGGAAAARRHGGGGAVARPARCRRPPRRPGARGGGNAIGSSFAPYHPSRPDLFRPSASCIDRPKTGMPCVKPGMAKRENP